LRSLNVCTPSDGKLSAEDKLLYDIDVYFLEPDLVKDVQEKKVRQELAANVEGVSLFVEHFVFKQKIFEGDHDFFIVDDLFHDGFQVFIVM
jgi:hypothetical protein